MDADGRNLLKIDAENAEYYESADVQNPPYREYGNLMKRPDVLQSTSRGASGLTTLHNYIVSCF
jgi:hypothetical protein